MQGKINLKALISFSTILGAAMCSGIAHGAEPLYASPIPDDLNVRFVENRIVIDRPASKVFDWVITPKNMPKWFVPHWDVVTGGPADQPQKIGDSTVEGIGAPKPGDHLYTVVALVPGFDWTAVSRLIQPNGQPSKNIQSIANFIVEPLSDGKCMFIRIYENVRPDPRFASPGTVDYTSVPRKGSGVQDPELMQARLVRLKQVVESELPAD